jgi:tripartite-type tricarboxylate transporter receptor subunit TctC
MVLLPKGTPAPIVQKLNAALSQALDTPTTQERLLNIGLDIPGPDKRSPEYAAKFIESEIKKYEGPIKAAGIVIE